MTIPHATEKLLQDTILSELERGRRNYDKPHTISVVTKVRDLIKNNPDLKLDEAVLVIVAYAHDWGYADLFKEGEVDFDAVLEVKQEHMRLSSQKIESLLISSVFNFLTVLQKKRIVKIVSKHDNLDLLHEIDELIFMEADTLGALDLKYVTPTFDKASNERYINGPLQERIKKFITSYGKTEVQKLINERRDYYERLK